MKNELWQYILDNFTIDNDGRKIICNILDWIWLQWNAFDGNKVDLEYKI